MRSAPGYALRPGSFVINSFRVCGLPTASPTKAGIPITTGYISATHEDSINGPIWGPGEAPQELTAGAGFTEDDVLLVASSLADGGLLRILPSGELLISSKGRIAVRKVGEGDLAANS